MNIDLDSILFVLGLLGFMGGIVAVIALWAQRDASRQKERQAKVPGSDGSPR
jgi:hypothetical protein